MRTKDNTPLLAFAAFGDLRLASPDAEAAGLSDAEKLDSLLGELAGKALFVGQNAVPIKAPGGRENSWTDGLPREAAAWRHMPDVSREIPGSAPGLFLRVFDDGVMF